MAAGGQCAMNNLDRMKQTLCADSLDIPMPPVLEVSICMCVYVGMYCVYVGMYCVYVCMYVCMYVYMYVYMYV